MIYCMADIHGDYERYQKMLSEIQFSDEDTLYVIGDVIDRGPRGVDLVLDMMNRPNVVFLRGNHEQMCLEDLLWHVWDARARWRMNGGSRTRSDLLYKRTPAVRARILHYFRNAPTCADLEVKGRRFHLVHGFPSENEHDRMWERPDVKAQAPMQGVTVVVGHTPTILLTGDDSLPLSIWHGDGIIDIDCGCGSQLETRRLACLRLDDMAEFYT